jgi:ribosomal RNA-processing protein 8
MSKIFRYYQEEADKAIYEELLINNNNKCIVKMFCGTGKSLLMRKCKVIEDKQLVVFVFPSLSLIDQFYDEYLNDYPSKNTLKISSEKEATTNPIKIQQFLSKKTNRIICITYQSFKTLIDCLGENKINVCIFDEAHHAVGEIYQTFIFQNDVCEKQIFFTATPKNANGIVMYDREQLDSGMCGKLVYDYAYLQGMNEDYLNPFEIRIDMFTENTNKSIYESIARAILSSGNNRVLTFHSDVNTERDTSVNNFVNEKEFKIVFKEIQKKEFPQIKKYKKISMMGLSALVNGKQRQKILETFDMTEDHEIKIISSCETIGEGIDTKKANMCVFVDPKSSYVKIIQNIGRIVRKQSRISSILIPCWVDKTKYLDCNGDRDKCDEVIRQDMSDGGNFNGILNVLSALKQEDEELYDICLYYPDRFSPQEIKSNLEKQGYTIEEQVGDGGLLETMEHLLETDIDYENYEYCETEEEMIMNIAEENDVCIEIHTNSLENPVERYNSEGGNGEVVRLYKEFNEETEEDVYQPIVKKENKKRRNVDRVDGPKRENRLNIKVHTNPDIKVLWNITSDIDITKDVCSCVIDCEVVDKWYDNFEELKQFIDEHKKRPSHGSKDTVEKKLGNWISDQLKNYKKCIRSMKDEDKRSLLSEFLQTYKEYFKSNDEIWYETFEKVKQFIDETKKRPSENSKDSTPYEKILGGWINTQQTNYKKQINSMKDEDKRNLWSEFLQTYKEYFKSNDEIWYETFEKVKQFIDKNNKRPSHGSKDTEEKKLCRWINTQQKNYKNKKEAMKDEDKRNLLSEFLQTYKEYFKSNDEIWYETFEKVKQFINNNQKRPSTISKDTEEKKLGSWISTQQQNYKNKAMNEKDKRNLWSEFLQTYKEYFKSNDDIWYETFEKVKQFIDENKKRPSCQSNDTEVKKLGTWISTQQQNYKNKKQAMNDEDTRKIWYDFLEEYKEYFVSDDEIWYNTLQKVKQFIDEHKKRPLHGSKDTVEKKLGSWISNQQINYKKQIKSMNEEDKRKIWSDFLEEYKEYFVSYDEIWYETFERVKQFINNNQKKPLEKSKDTEEKKLGAWISHQQQNYKSKKQTMKDEDKRNLWFEFLEKYKQYFDKKYKEYFDSSETQSIASSSSNTETETETETETIEKENIPKKSMKLKTPSAKSKKETPEQKKERVKSEISQLHQKYKTMKSENLHKEFNEDRQLWNKYHEISEENEKSFPEHEIPRNRMITELNKIKTKRTKKVVDMGCGKGQISQYFQNDTRFNFTNYDHVSSNDTIISCDISNIPLEEDSVEICILSLAMWGSNCKEYVKEANRILESGGKLYIIEPTKRWSAQDENGNIISEKEGCKMKSLLEENGFQIVEQSIEKFCMFICIKV